MKRFDVNLFLADLKAIEDQKLELTRKEHTVTGDMEESKAAAEALKEEYDRISEGGPRVGRKDLRKAERRE